MVDFFKYENQREPPFLSDCGSLVAGHKLDILACIKAPTACVCTARQVLFMVFDMAFIIHMVRPTRVPVCISKCCSFPRESTDVYSGACRRNLGLIPWKTQITDSEETWNRCSYTTWTKQWRHFRYYAQRLWTRRRSLSLSQVGSVVRGVVLCSCQMSKRINMTSGGRVLWFT